MAQRLRFAYAWPDPAAATVAAHPRHVPRRTTTMSTVERIPSAVDLDLEAPTATPTVSVVIPCLNECVNVAACVEHAWAGLDACGLPGEVIVVDNASDDGSAELAAAAGAFVVHEPRRGYGSAYLAGFDAARGDYIVMADADLTYDFGDIPRFV